MLVGNHVANLDHMMTRVIDIPRSTVSLFEEEAYGALLTLVYAGDAPSSPE